jgi:hypothetical protein
MHIEPTTHEHGPTARVYTYEADFDVGDDAIRWQARITHPDDQPRVLAGSIPITSPAMAALADKAVRDAIVHGIDAQFAPTTVDATPRPATVPAVRTALHDALEALVGQWRAEGLWFGGPEQSDVQPRLGAQPWKSTHSARWHEGRFFLVQEERAHAGTQPLDTMAVLGVDLHSGTLFVLGFHSRGLARRYDVAIEGARWRLSSATERTTIEFSADGRTQRIQSQWRPRDRWLPLCERTAVRVD